MSLGFFFVVAVAFAFSVAAGFAERDGDLPRFLAAISALISFGALVFAYIAS